MKIVMYRDTAGEWRWRAVAANGNILADSGEGYKRRIDCLSGLETVTGTTEVNGELVSFRTKPLTLEVQS